MNTFPSASKAAYILSALLFGMLTATAQGFPLGSAEWWGAASAPLLLGLIIGLIIRIFRKTTNVYKIAFWWAVIAMVIAAISKTP